MNLYALLLRRSTRTHPKSVNINVSSFYGVDVVSDAHDLPYSDNSVDSITIEDVLEHIKNPQRVVDEIARVMKPGGYVYAATPFLIAYHGYPYHFQNYTLTGQECLF